MRNLLGLCSLLLASASVLAQTPSSHPVIILEQPGSQNCPVGLSARHANSGGMVTVSPASKARGQAYSISFAPSQFRGIAQVKITLYGMAGSHVLPAAATGKSDATESFTLAPAAGANNRFHSVVYIQKLTGVQWVELNQVTYADGTEWHASPTAACRVAPDGYMLVASGN